MSFVEQVSKSIARLGFVLTLCLFQAEWGCYAAAEPVRPEIEVKLTGIFHYRGENQAFLEITSTIGGRKGGTFYPILRTGEREGAVEILKIEPAQRSIRLRKGNREEVLTIPHDASEAVVNPTLYLRSVRLDQVLYIYQEMSGRTVLATRTWPMMKMDVISEAGLTREEVVSVLEKALAAQGFVTKELGEKVVAIVTRGALPSLDGLPGMPQMAGGAAEAAPKEVFEPGLIRFQDTDAAQALDIYQEMSGRTVLRPANPLFKLTVRTQTRMTREEAVWLLEALLYMHGIAMVKEGDKWVFAVPLAMTKNLPHYAPEGILAKFKKAPGVEPVTVKLVDADCEQLLKVYAELTGRQAVPVAGNIPRMRLSVRSQTALTPPEAVYTLEALAAVNELLLEAVEADQVQLSFSGKPRANLPRSRSDPPTLYQPRVYVPSR